MEDGPEPKIELHVHLEGTVRPAALIAIARRNGVPLPTDTVRFGAARGVVCDVCPVSNPRTVAVPSLADHPLPAMVAAGVDCSISTDDPAMFDTDLSRDYAAAAELGHQAESALRAGVRGALCDDTTRAALSRIADSTTWRDG